MQRIRIRYAKRGPLRFTSHRDFARAFERALRRAAVPIAFSQGFTPHPKVSYASAAPTGVASEAEYLEIALQTEVDPQELVRALDAALSPGLDILEAVVAHGGNLAERIDASSWQIDVFDVPLAELEAAVATFMATDEVPVQRLTKQGMRTFDTRSPVVRMSARASSATETLAPSAGAPGQYAILDLVVRLVSPTVRPDDVLSGLRVVAALEPPTPPRATRIAQGVITASGDFVDPLAADRDEAGDGALTIGTPPASAG